MNQAKCRICEKEKGYGKDQCRNGLFFKKLRKQQTLGRKRREKMRAEVRAERAVDPERFKRESPAMEEHFQRWEKERA